MFKTKKVHVLITCLVLCGFLLLSAYDLVTKDEIAFELAVEVKGYGELEPEANEANTTLLVNREKTVTAVFNNVNEEEVVIRPKEYEGAVRNPFKGLRGYRETSDYMTLIKDYVEWNKIEDNVNDGVEKIIEYSNREWEGFEERNLKVMPRVYLYWPNRGEYWPSDMETGDFESEQFKERVVALIEKMAEAWDNDPRVAYIEMGLVGKWGEHHSPEPSEEMQKLLGDAFSKNFENKLIMIRRPTLHYLFQNYNFGIYWDMWGGMRQWDGPSRRMKTLTEPPFNKRWQTAVIGGERGGNIQQAFWEPFGLDKDVSADDSFTKYLDKSIDVIRILHGNHIGDFINPADLSNPEVLAGVREVHKALGYRFVIESVRYNSTVSEDNKLNVSFSLKNTGSTPFYYNWPVEVSLLDPVTRKPVWKDVFKDLDIRKWLPGDEWNVEERKYDIAAKVYDVEGSFSIPEKIQAGEYILALAILDPAGNLPAARFAMENYFKGGRHPIGKIGVRSEIIEAALDPSIFDDIASDRSLHYKLD